MEERQLRMLGVLVAILLVLTLAYNQLGAPEEPFDPQATEPVWTVVRDEVQRFELERPAGRLIFERSGDGWQLREPVDEPADTYVVNKLLTDLTHIDKGIPLPDLAPADVGLGDEPRARVVLTDEAGASHSLTLGIDAPVGYASYVLAPSGVVTAVDAEFADIFDKELSHFRDKHLVRVEGAKVRRIRITSADGVLDVSGSEKAWWMDGFGRADAAKVDDLISGLRALRYELVQEGEPEPMTEPVYQVLIETTDEEVELHVGDRTPMGQVVHVLGTSVGMVEPATLALLGQGPPDLGDDHAVPAWPHRLEEVEVALGDQGWHLTKNDEGVWTSEGAPEPAADAWLTAMAAATVHYRREAVPDVTGSWGTVRVDHDDLEPITITFGQVVDGTWRVAQDSRGGDPYLVPVADLEALASASTR